jgi:hypothetical protein
MAGSTVQVYSVNPADGSNAANLVSTTTDPTGFFQLSLKSQSRPARIVVSGGSLLSEADGATISSPDPISVLLPSAPGGPMTANVNPLTYFIDQMAMININYLHQSFSAALKNATSKVEQVYGLSSNPSQLAADYATSGTDAANLGLILGALINEDQALCPGSPGGLVTALATDLADGAFDGQDANGASIDYCGGSLAAIAGTSIFQDALSGLQQLQMISGPFAFGGNGNSLSANGLADIATGGSTSYPLAPLALINSAIGPNAAPVSVDAFAPTTPNMNQARQSATATLLPNGEVLIAGGFSDMVNFQSGPFQVTLSSTEIYDPVANTFAASTPSMNQARMLATATLLPNGKVLIAGGFNVTVDSAGVVRNTPLSSTEIYDPATNTFAASTPSMNQARGNATATLLPNGKVLVAGGVDVREACINCSSTASTEIYDPATNTFAASTPSMNQARAGATATLLPNGKVLIAGGSISFDTSTEIYDPATDTFAASTPSMDQSPAGTATLLPNGKVLIERGSSLVSSKTIYNPITNTFAPSTPAPLTSSSATATLLPNGKVLIAGGNVFTIGFGPLSIASTSIYSP